MTRARAEEREKLPAPPTVAQPHVVGKWNDLSILRSSSDTPVELMAKAAILVSAKERRKNRPELRKLLDDLNNGELSDETVLRHVAEMPFGRSVDASGLLVAAVQLCQQHCLQRGFWQEKVADFIELVHIGKFDVEAALHQLNAVASTADSEDSDEMLNK